MDLKKTSMIKGIDSPWQVKYLSSSLKRQWCLFEGSWNADEIIYRQFNVSFFVV